jgi:hydrogenase nickel incorporation protein HypA/HybF
MRLVELAAEKAGQSGAARVVAVHLRLGALAGVAKEALRFSFDVVCQGTGLEGARLVIDEVPVVVMCPRCRTERVLGQVLRFCCPACGTPTADVVRGRELELAALEVSDDAPAHC